MKRKKSLFQAVFERFDRVVGSAYTLPFIAERVVYERLKMDDKTSSSAASRRVSVFLTVSGVHAAWFSESRVLYKFQHLRTQWIRSFQQEW
jgi:hypothetical protein